MVSKRQKKGMNMNLNVRWCKNHTVQRPILTPFICATTHHFIKLVPVVPVSTPSLCVQVGIQQPTTQQNLNLGRILGPFYIPISFRLC